jgi:DNA-directed RNA polymerase subunit RPC12/RpoP
MRIKHAAYVRREDCPAHLTWGPIVELPYRVSDMTIGFLLDLTRSHSLVADREILTGYACQHCGGAETAYRPYHKEDLRLKCPRCGGQRLFDVAVSLGAGAAGIPLSQLGIPPLAVVALRGGAGWQYVEFSGDRAAYPDFEAEPRETSG